LARILIVDDDEADRILLEAALKREGHETYLAGDGEEALASFVEVPFELVITDLQMPNVHGLELISRLKNVAPRPAIVAISGTGEPQLDIAHAIGADAMVAKPVAPHELLEAVGAALAASADRRRAWSG